MKSFILVAVFLIATCTAQYQQNQYQYQQQLYQQHQQRYQQQHYQQQPYQYAYQGRVDPRAYLGQTATQTRTSDDRRVKKKPSYGRVDPNAYRSIMNNANKQQVIVYPQKQVQVMYPRYQTKQAVQQMWYPIYQKKIVQPYIRTINKPVQTGYRPKWPKLKGHCKKVPADIKINGVHPVERECKKGNAVLVFFMKRRCDFCYHQLKALNKLAKHYKDHGKPLSVVAINHKRGPLAPAVRKQFPHVKIYDEPDNMDIFGKIGGIWRHVILYDVCCRKQYVYGYPFNFMKYNIIKHALHNTMYYDQLFCGVCKAATTPPPTTTTTTTLPPTTLPREARYVETMPREDPPTEEPW